MVIVDTGVVVVEYTRRGVQMFRISLTEICCMLDKWFCEEIVTVAGTVKASCLVVRSCTVRSISFFSSDNIMSRSEMGTQLNEI